MKKFRFDVEKFSYPLDKYFIPWIRDLNEELREQPDSIENFTDILLNSERVFTCAKGRSELVTQYAGTRLLHIGYEVFQVGYSYTPSIGKKKDVLLCVSGSGKTKSVVNCAESAKKQKVPILSITSKPDSNLADISDEIIIIKGRTKDIIEYEKRQLEKTKEPISYLGSEFEFKAFACLELIENYVAKRKGVSEKDMKGRHPNME